MNDKTETQALVDMLGVFARRASEVGKHGIAEAIAKASLQLHDQAEEIELLKAEVAAVHSEKEKMARRQLEAAEGARQRGPLTSGEQEAMRNFLGAAADAQNNFIPDAPPTTLWARFKRWIRA